MLRGERGQVASEYLGLLLIAALVIGALTAGGALGTIASGVETAICRVAGGECAAEASPGGDSAAALTERLNRLEPLVGAHGGGIEDLAEQAEAAIARGDLDEAQELIERLELYRDLIAAGPRGATLADLVAPTDEEFAALIEQGTIQADDDATNRRYFQLPPAPRQGIFVMDLFIPGESAGPLKGDGRDFTDPLRTPGLELTDSRGMIIIDRETGRGVVIQSESCTVSVFGGDFCNEPRPISINGDLGLIENDEENDVTGEGVNLDVTNNYDITPDGDGFRLEYESRNSVSPFPAISGDVTFQPGDDDGRLEITEDDRDGFPAYQTEQYRPGEDDNVIEQREAGSPFELVTPADLPDLPDLPGPGFDLPNLPNLPQPPSLPNPPNLPDLPDGPDLPDLPDPPGPIGDLPNLPDLPDLPDLPG
jgi:hypothetical protein